MAKQSRTSFQKRNRERRKAEKAAMKRERREQRKNALSQGLSPDPVAADGVFPVPPAVDAETPSSSPEDPPRRETDQTALTQEES